VGARASSNGAIARRVAAACLCFLPVASACGGKSRVIDHTEATSEPDGVELFDDMEPDGDSDREAFAWMEGQIYGHWWSPGAGHDLIEGVVPPREASTMACHLSGAGGDRLVAILRAPNYFPVSLGEYRGLVFHARLKGTSDRLVVAMDSTAGSSFPSRAFSVSAEWERFELPFDELSPTFGGTAASIDFIAGEGREPFDLWIDDVWLVCRGACPTRDVE
jgi:hypothetical protein